MPQGFELKKVTPHCGAEVEGLDLSQPLDAGTAGALQSALAEGWAPREAEREAALRDWASAPGARGSHPREEHLVPVFVAAGAAGDDEGAEVFRDQVMGAVVSGVRFG